MEPAKGHTTGGVTDSCCSRGGGQENNVNSDCAMSDCESDCSQFEESPAMAPAAVMDSAISSGNGDERDNDDDDILNGAEALTRDEVIRRRLWKLRKLERVYKDQYWGLIKELRSKHRRFFLRHGRGGWRDDAEEREGADGEEGAGGVGMREPGGNSEDAHCGAQGCTAKPLQLSVFCLAHILLEPRQKLYRPCSHVIRTGVTCGKPVLRAVVPSLCAPHFHQAQRQATRSLNKVLPGGIKFNPNIHLIVAQYVRTIQSKRRSHRAALTKKTPTAVKVEVNGKGGGPPRLNGKEVLSSKGGGPPRSNGKVVLSSKGGGPPRSNGKVVLSSKEGGPPRSNGKIVLSKEGGPPRSNGKAISSSKGGAPPRSNGSNGKGVLSSKEGGPPRSNGKGVLSSQERGPSRSSFSGKAATKAAVHNDEEKPLANGQSKGSNGVVLTKGNNGVAMDTT